MKIESYCLQSNHSDWMRLVASLDDDEKASKVYAEFVRHLQDLFSRADKFSCAGFGMPFETRKEFQEWKKKEWDPVADERCTLSLEERDGRIYVSGDYGLVLDDWSREETAIALDSTTIALRVYTAGYGLDHLDEWLTKRGAFVQISVEGEEHAYLPFDMALEEVKAQTGKKWSCRVRAQDRDHAAVRQGREHTASPKANPV